MKNQLPMLSDAIDEKIWQIEYTGKNNAAVNGSGIPWLKMTTEVFDKTIRTNLCGTFSAAEYLSSISKRTKSKGKIYQCYFHS